MAKNKESSYLAWDWKKQSFVPQSEIDTKQRPPLWTSPDPRPRYPGTAIVDKDSLAPEGFSPLPFACKDMKGLEVIVWDVRSCQWVEGVIDEVFINERASTLTYVVVTTAVGKLRAYTLETVRVIQQTECKVEVAA